MRMRSGNHQRRDKGGFAEESSSGFTRIEPSIGVESKPRRPVRNDFVANENHEPTVSSNEQDTIRDVLMESYGSRRARTGEGVNEPARRFERVAPAEQTSSVSRREQGYERVTPRGQRVPRATKSIAVPNWRGWINPKWLLAILLVLCGIGIYWVSEPLSTLLERPFKSVVVEGEFHYISKTRATELIGQEIDNNFLRLDLMRIKHSLVDDPWVDSVSLSRRWPDTLVVKIIEENPIARWGDGFLNQRGEIINVADTKPLTGLPWLQGNEANAVEILQQYQDLSQLLRSRGLDVIALKCDNKKSWRLTLKNNVEIAIGRDQVMEKMRRFVTVYDTHLSELWSDVKAIDVRYSNGLAVRWIENSESAKTYLKNRVQAANNSPGASVNP